MMVSVKEVLMMRYIFALLLTLAIAIAAAPGPALAQDGPSVCQYHDGTVLNVGQVGGCNQPPWLQRN
jgi:hypothetical protein